MWKEQFEPENLQKSHGEDQPDPSLRRLFAVAFAAALALAFASLIPGPLVAPVMRELLFFAAWCAVLVAVLRREEPFAQGITAWDQAAIFLLLSLFSGFFVEPAAVAEALNEITATAPPG